MGAPAIMNHFTIADSEHLSERWLKGIEKEFDLPGELPQHIHSRASLITQLLLMERDGASHAQVVDLFRPGEFEAGLHLGAVVGYTVFTQFGERFVSGGRPISRKLDNSELKKNFKSVLSAGRPISFFNKSKTDEHRVVTVLVPLF